MEMEKGGLMIETNVLTCMGVSVIMCYIKKENVTRPSLK